MEERRVIGRALNVLKETKDSEFWKKYITKESAFSRVGSQKMSVHDMTMFTMANTGKTLSIEIFEFFEHMNKPDDAVTKQALSKQRQYVDSKIFSDLNKLYVKKSYACSNRTFCGYNVIAVDGSTMEIPNTKEMKEIYGAAKASKTSSSNARIGLNGFYDPLNNFLIRLVVDKYQKAEKTVFLENIDELLEMYARDKILFIFDRGYICMELLLKLSELGVKYLFRLPSYCYKEEREKATKKDEVIEIKITRARMKGVDKDKQKAYLLQGFKSERLVQVELDTGDIEYLLTNLSSQEVSSEEMKDLYWQRWHIEKCFNILKNRLHIENISARTKNGVEQDIQATVFLGNIIADMAKEINLQIPKKAKNKYEYRVNVNVLAGVVKTYFHYFFFTEAATHEIREKYQKRLLEFVKSKIIARKTGITNPRIVKVSRNKHKTNIRRNM